MRGVVRGVTTAVLTVAAVTAFAAPAAAHPTDEVVQQVYLTPATSGLTVQLDLTPGVLVGAAFAGAIDSNGNGSVDPAEVDAHTGILRSALVVDVDGRAVDLTPVEQRYPPVALLAAGGAR